MTPLEQFRTGLIKTQHSNGYLDYGVVMQLAGEAISQAVEAATAVEKELADKAKEEAARLRTQRDTLEEEIGSLVVEVRTLSTRVRFESCARCGCYWRDNGDGTMSLGNRFQASCEHCETAPFDTLSKDPKESR